MQKYFAQMPQLGQMQQPQEEWEGNAPRLTEEQKRQVQRITRGIFMRHMKKTPTRGTFNQIHERIEEEAADKIKSLMGLKARLEWRIVFGESAAYFFQKIGMPQPTFVDGILPTEDFIQSELFDYVQMFEPVVTLDQFEDYTNFMDSAESSIKDAENRRNRGDAYYTDLDRQISFRPDVGAGDSLDDE